MFLLQVAIDPFARLRKMAKYGPDEIDEVEDPEEQEDPYAVRDPSPLEYQPQEEPPDPFARLRVMATTPPPYAEPPTAEPTLPVEGEPAGIGSRIAEFARNLLSGEGAAPGTSVQELEGAYMASLPPEEQARARIEQEWGTAGPGEAAARMGRELPEDPQIQRFAASAGVHPLAGLAATVETAPVHPVHRFLEERMPESWQEHTAAGREQAREIAGGVRERATDIAERLEAPSEDDPAILNLISSGLGSSVIPLATGRGGFQAAKLLGAGAKAAVRAGMGSAIAGSQPISANEMYRYLTDIGVEGDKLGYGVQVGSAVMAALEGVVPGDIATRVMPRATELVGESLLKAMGKATIRESAQEAGTEMLQTQIPQIARELLAEFPEMDRPGMLEHLIETLKAGAGGALVGGILGAGGPVAGRVAGGDPPSAGPSLPPQPGLDALRQATQPAEPTYTIELPQVEDRPVVSDVELEGMEPAAPAEQEAEEGWVDPYMGGQEAPGGLEGPTPQEAPPAPEEATPAEGRPQTGPLTRQIQQEREAARAEASAMSDEEVVTAWQTHSLDSHRPEGATRSDRPAPLGAERRRAYEEEVDRRGLWSQTLSEPHKAKLLDPDYLEVVDGEVRLTTTDWNAGVQSLADAGMVTNTGRGYFVLSREGEKAWQELTGQTLVKPEIEPGPFEAGASERAREIANLGSYRLRSRAIGDIREVEGVEVARALEMVVDDILAERGGRPLRHGAALSVIESPDAGLAPEGEPSGLEGPTPQEAPAVPTEPAGEQPDLLGGRRFVAASKRLSDGRVFQGPVHGAIVDEAGESILTLQQGLERRDGFWDNERQEFVTEDEAERRAIEAGLIEPGSATGPVRPESSTERTLLSEDLGLKPDDDIGLSGPEVPAAPEPAGERPDLLGGQEVPAPTTPATGDLEAQVPEAISMESGTPSVTRDPTGALHATVRARDIHRDPERFQFKRTDREGVQQRLHGDFDPFLAGTIEVLRDPADGRLYVWEGHHRHLAALEAGEDTPISVRIHDISPERARYMGALKNIAEGNATATDAAKFLREENLTEEELSAANIDLRKDVTRLGVQLAQLPDDIFTRVTTGDLTERMGAAIGDSGLSEAGMRALADMVRNKPDMPISQVRELARFVESAGETTESQETLFGTEELSRSNALEKAQLSSRVKRRLSRDKNLYSYVAKPGRAQRLEESEAGQINVEQASDLANQAARLEEAYDKLSTMAGPVSDALNAAAQELAAGGNEAEIVERLHGAVKEAIQSDPDIRRLFGGDIVSEATAEFEGEPGEDVESEINRLANEREEEHLTAREQADRLAAELEPSTEGIDLTAIERLGREGFLGEPTITMDDNANQLRPIFYQAARDAEPEPFMDGRFLIYRGEDAGSEGVGWPFLHHARRGSTVILPPEPGDTRDPRPIASYNGDVLVVDPEFRGQGIATELVMDFRSRNPDVPPARYRTRGAQATQERAYDRLEGEIDARRRRGLEGPEGVVREDMEEFGGEQWDPDPVKVREAYDRFNFDQHNVTFEEVLDYLPEAAAKRPWNDPNAVRSREYRVSRGETPMSQEQHAVAAAISHLSRGKGLEMREQDRIAREGLEGPEGIVREQVDAFGEDLRGPQEEMELGPRGPERGAEAPSGQGALAASEDIARSTVERIRPLVEAGEATPDQREQYRQALALLNRNDALTADEARLLAQVDTEADVESGDLFGDLEGPEGVVREDVEEFGLEGPESVMDEMKTGEGKVGAGLDKSLFKKLGANLYKENLTAVAFKEGLQNSVDATLNVPNPRIEIDVDTTRRRVTIRDNGTGMSPEVAANEFMDVGGSAKGELSSGGYGLAKVGLLAHAAHFKLTTTTADGTTTTIEGSSDDWAGGDLDYNVKPGTPGASGIQQALFGGTRPQGTELTITFEKDSNVEWYDGFRFLEQFLTYDRTGTQVEVTRDGRPWPTSSSPVTPFKGDGNPTTVDVPGAQVRFEPSKETSYSSRIIFLNRGLYQFQKNQYYEGDGKGYPKIIVVDVHPTVDTDHADYPFTTNRENAKQGVTDAVEQYTADITNREVRKRLDTLMGALNEPARIPGGYSVYATSGTVSKATLEMVASSAYADPLTDVMGIVAQDIFDRTIAHTTYTAMPPFEFGGIGISSDYLGVNIRRSMLEAVRKQVPDSPYDPIPDTNLILVNPFAHLTEIIGTGGEVTARELAEQTWGTLVHEVAHREASGHGEEFSGVLTRLIGPMTEIQARSIADLEVAWEHALAEGILDDLATVKGEWHGENIFESISDHAQRGDRGRADADVQAERAPGVDRVRGEGRAPDEGGLRAQEGEREEGPRRPGAPVRGADAGEAGGLEGPGGGAVGAAAWQDPVTGQTHRGPTHTHLWRSLPDQATKDRFQELHARNDPSIGFVDDQGAFMSRGDVARRTGGPGDSEAAVGQHFREQMDMGLEGPEPSQGVSLTAAELDLAEWAVDPHRDFFRLDEGDEGVTEADAADIVDGRLVIPTRAAAEDLLYRLEGQLEDMIDENMINALPSQFDAKAENQQLGADRRTARRLAAKIRSEMEGMPEEAPRGAEPLPEEGLTGDARVEALQDRLDELDRITQEEGRDETPEEVEEIMQILDELNDISPSAPRLTGPVSVPGRGLVDPETGEAVREQSAEVLAWGSEEAAAEARVRIAEENEELLALDPDRRERMGTERDEQIEENLAVDLAGLTVRGPREIATIHGMFRSPTRESVTVTFLVEAEGGGWTVLDHQVHTSGIVNFAWMSSPDIIDRIVATAESLGATAISTAHNHPSGNPYRSDDDVAGHQGLERKLDPHGLSVVDSVVTDHGTAYSIANELAGADPYVEYDMGGTPDWAAQGPHLRNSEQVAEFAGRLSGGDGYALVWMGSDGKAIALSPHLAGDTSLLEDPIAFNEKMRKLGAVRAVAVVNRQGADPDALYETIAGLQRDSHLGWHWDGGRVQGLIDVILADGTALEHSAMKAKELTYYGRSMHGARTQVLREGTAPYEGESEAIAGDVEGEPVLGMEGAETGLAGAAPEAAGEPGLREPGMAPLPVAEEGGLRGPDAGGEVAARSEVGGLEGPIEGAVRERPVDFAGIPTRDYEPDDFLRTKIGETNLDPETERLLRDELSRATRATETKRRKVTREDVEDLAAKIGQDPRGVVRLLERRGLDGAEQLALLSAARSNTARMGEALRALRSGEHPDGSPVHPGERTDLEAEVSRRADINNLLLSKWAREGSEAGRSLWARQLEAFSMEDPTSVLELARRLKERSGGTHDLTKDEQIRVQRAVESGNKDLIAQQLMSFDRTSPVSKFFAVMKASMLSLFQTHNVNLSSNAIKATIMPVERFYASLWDRALARKRESITGEKHARTVEMGQADVKGARAFAPASLKAVNAYRYALTGKIPEGQGVAVAHALHRATRHRTDVRRRVEFGDPEKAGLEKPVSALLELYTNGVLGALGAGDLLFRHPARVRSLWEQASIAAQREGLDKGTPEFAARVQHLVDDPTPAMEKQADLDSNESVFMDATGIFDGIDHYIQEVKRGEKLGIAGQVGAELTFPFTRTLLGIADQTTDLTGIGLLRGYINYRHLVKFLHENAGAPDKQLALGSQTALSPHDPQDAAIIAEMDAMQKNVAKQLGRGSLGAVSFMLAAMLGGYLRDRDRIKTRYPTDPREQELWRAQDIRTNSILINGKWRQVDFLGPYGLMLMIGAHQRDIIDSWGEERSEGVFREAVGRTAAMAEQLMRVIGAITIAQGLETVSDITGGVEGSLEAFAHSVARMPYPNILRGIARTIDPVRRDADYRDALQQYAVSTPGFSQGFPPRVDAFGNDIVGPEGIWANMFSPSRGARPDKTLTDPLLAEATRLGTMPIRPRRSDVERWAEEAGIEFTSQTWYSVQKYYGNRMASIMQDAFTDPVWLEMSDEEKREDLERQWTNEKTALNGELRDEFYAEAEAQGIGLEGPEPAGVTP